MSSTGKIARLPKYVRDQLNQRLDDGQSANEILRWLNQLPECREMLDEKFDSRPITRQNLSQWKQGGYQTWLRVEETREQVQSLFEHAQDLETDDSGSLNADGMTFADRLGALMAVQLLTAIQKLDDITDPDQRWHRLTGIVSQLSRLRREDHHGRRVRLAEEQWSDKCGRMEKQDEKDAKEATKLELRTWFWSTCGIKKKAEFLGGGDFGDKWADWLHRLECDLPRPDWWKGPWTNHSPAEHFDSNHMAPQGPDAQSQSKTSKSALRQERRSPDRRDPKDSKPAKSSPSKKCNHLARNGIRRAGSRPDGRRRKHETRIPSTPDPRPSSTSPSSCKVNQSKSKLQRSAISAKVGQASCLSPSSSKTSESTPPLDRQSSDRLFPKSDSSDLSDSSDSPPPAVNPAPPSTP